MRKLKLFLDAKAANTPPRGISKASRVIFSVLTLLLLSVGNVWAVDYELVYTLDGSVTSNASGSSAYATAIDIVDNGITWNVMGNTTLNPWGIGGKNLSSTGRSMYSKGAVAGNILKIEIEHGAASSVTVNSMKVEVATDAAFANIVSTCNPTFAASSTVTVNHPDGDDAWENCYYRITYYLTIGSSNKKVEFKSAKFYKEYVAPAIPTCATPTFDPEDGETFTDDIDVEIASATEGVTIYYTTDGNDPTTSSSVYSSALNFTETTTLKAMAVKAGYDNSAVATATYTKVVPFSGSILEIVKGDFTTSSYDENAGDHEKSGITFTTAKVYQNGGGIQFQKTNGLLYNKTDLGEIAKIEITKVSGKANNLVVYAGTTENPSSTSVTGSASGDVTTYTFASGYGYFAVKCNGTGASNVDPIKVYYTTSSASIAKPTISGETPFVGSTEVTITAEGADAIYYTLDGTDPTTISAVYSAPFPLTNSATVKAIAVKGSDVSAVAEKTFTKQTVLTVAEAIALIPNKDDVVNDQYVAGIVCTAAPSLLSGGKLTYYISADGSETNRLQIYHGKNLNNTDFTAVSDLAIGDRVTVFGQLKNFNNTPEMNDGNYLVSKAAPAVAAPVFSPNGGGFMGETDVTITCETASNTIYYTLDGTTPSKSSNVYSEPIHLNATTTITAIAYVGEESSLVVAKEFTHTAPMTVAEAYDALTGDDINNAAVAGIVYQVDNISSGHATYWISDNGEAGEKVLEVYNGYGLNGASIAAGGIQVGDEVTVFGNLTIYVKNETSTKEFAAGSRLLVFNRPEVAVTGVSLTESTAEVEVGKTVNLHASVVPAKATNKTIVWSVQSGNDYASVDENGVVTGIAAGEAVVRATAAADENIYAECTVTVTEPAPLSPWASVYTSNVTLTGAKVKFYGEETEYDAVKAGTGKVAGSVDITIPAQATKLHFHAYGWNGETVGLTVTAPAGVTVSPATEISINSNDGIANNSPFTLAEGSDPKTDAYYAVSLSGNTEPVALTISATTGKRFVLFGVNQEGGIVLESIAISGTASVLEYNDGDHFDPAGLVVTGTYSDASTAPITEGIDWTFDPDPLTEGTTSVSVTATVSEISSTAFVVNGLTVNGAAPLSPWASVYTSNVTIASSESKQVTIDETDYPAAKSNKGASATITLPQGVTKIHLHLVAWKDEAQTVSVTGDCFNEAKELTIVANDGVAGSGTTYDLGASGVDYYFSLTPDNAVAADEVITITATSGKRFVLFGVNQEGGIIPELQSLAISGDLENKEYEAGAALNMAGLTVMGTYTLGGTPQTPVDVTDQVEEWLYDALQVGDESVTISAKIGDVTSAGYEITGLTVTDPTPRFETNPASYISFGSKVQGAEIAARDLEVSLINVAAASVLISGEGAAAFSVDEDALTGNATLHVSASSANVGTFAATLTISDDASEAADKEISLSLTVTAPEVPESAVSTTSEWVAATDADLVDGAEVLITGVKNDVVYAMGAQGNNNRVAVAASINGDVLTPGENTMAFTLEAQEGGTFALRASNGNYLYAASSSSNHLKSQATVNDNAKWTLSVTSAVAKSSSNRNVMQFNGGSSLFSCYASASQTAIKLYVPKPAPAPDYGSYQRNVTSGNFGTICLPKAGTIEGATLFEIAYYDETAKKIYLDEVTDGAMVAGRPYIFQATATATELNVTYTSGDVVTTAGNYHGLYGFYDLNDENATTGNLTQDAGNYILYQNAYWLVKDRDAYVANYRAYIKLGVEGGAPTSAQAPAPGRRRVAMNVNGEQTATGINELNAAEAPVKMIIDGQMYILRGEKMYDTTGRLVK